MDFVCPKCKGIFILSEGGAKRCPLGHSFDRAKEGYYNLLMSSTRGVHGDNREMVLSRRAFLSKGYYQPLCDAVCSAVLSVTGRDGTVLDSGCGEGYYTSHIEKALSDRDQSSSVLAYDISKEAVRLAAKAYTRVAFSVAGSYDLPLRDGMIDTVVNVFSPLATDEVKRVLKAGGHFIMAFPGQRHLYGLKAVLYDNPYLNKPDDTDLEGFELVDERDVDYDITLDSDEDIKSLFMMTPYAYRTSKEGRERLLSLDTLKTEVSFKILTYMRI